MIKFIEWVLKYKTKLIIALTTFILISGVAAYLITGKVHNPVTHIASQIIQKETNIDIENMLADEVDNKATP